MNNAEESPSSQGVDKPSTATVDRAAVAMVVAGFVAAVPAVGILQNDYSFSQHAVVAIVAPLTALLQLVLAIRFARVGRASWMWAILPLLLWHVFLATQFITNRLYLSWVFQFQLQVAGWLGLFLLVAVVPGALSQVPWRKLRQSDAQPLACSSRDEAWVKRVCTLFFLTGALHSAFLLGVEYFSNYRPELEIEAVAALALTTLALVLRFSPRFSLAMFLAPLTAASTWGVACGDQFSWRSGRLTDAWREPPDFALENSRWVICGLALASLLALIAVAPSLRRRSAAIATSTPRDPVRQRRVRALGFALGGSVLTLVGVAGALKLWAERPFVNDAEVATAGALVRDAMQDARAQRCARPVLRGEAMPGDATADLAALLSRDGRFAPCLDFIRDRGAEVEDAVWLLSGLTEPYPNDPSWSPGATDHPPPPDESLLWWYPRQTRRVHRQALPIEREVLAVCAGLDAEVERIAQHESVCTPYPLGGAMPNQRLELLFDALAVFARERLRQGESRRGFELLLDGLQLAQDSERGRPHLVGAILAVVAEGQLQSQVQWLLLNETPWTAADLTALEAQARVLSASAPAPHRWMTDDMLSASVQGLHRHGMDFPEDVPTRDLSSFFGASEETERTQEAAIGFLLYAHPRLASLCDAATSEECALRLSEEAARPVSTWTRMSRMAPEMFHDGLQAALYEEWFTHMMPLLRRAWLAQARRSAVPILFVARRLALAGQCPSAEELSAASQLALPSELGGSLEILRSVEEFSPLDICAPRWLAPEGAERARLPLLTARCVVFPLPEAPAAPDANPEEPPTAQELVAP